MLPGGCFPTGPAFSQGRFFFGGVCVSGLSSILSPPLLALPVVPTPLWPSALLGPPSFLSSLPCWGLRPASEPSPCSRVRPVPGVLVLHTDKGRNSPSSFPGFVGIGGEGAGMNAGEAQGGESEGGGWDVVYLAWIWRQLNGEGLPSRLYKWPIIKMLYVPGNWNQPRGPLAGRYWAGLLCGRADRWTALAPFLCPATFHRAAGLLGSPRWERTGARGPGGLELPGRGAQDGSQLRVDCL